MALAFVVLGALQVVAAGAPPRLSLLQTSQAHGLDLRTFGHGAPAAVSVTVAAVEDRNGTGAPAAAAGGPAAFALAALTPYMDEGDEVFTAAEIALIAWTSDTSKSKGRLGVFSLGIFFGALFCGVVPLSIQALARSIGKAIEAGVEKSNSTIGVDARIGKVSVHVCEGYIAVHGLTVLNPNGYSSDYLLRVRKVHLDVHMSTLICSSFKQILVERLVFKGVDVWYNKTAKSSNINDVLCIRDPPADRALFGGKSAAAVDGDAEKGGGSAARGSPAHAKSGSIVTLREVQIEDVGMRMEHEMFKGSGLRTEMGDISFSDFAAETEIDEGSAHTVALRLLQGVLRSITKTAGGAHRSRRQGV